VLFVDWMRTALAGEITKTRSRDMSHPFVAAGAEGGPPTAISPLQADADQVLFFVGVADVAATLDQAEKLGGTIVQPAQQVPGVTFGVLADPQGHQIGIAAQA
jgi:predicted enzyme related to lactoylglutathione lyase